MRPAVQTTTIAFVALSWIAAAGCSQQAGDGTSSGQSVAEREAAAARTPTREAYFGNFHVHTSYSFDGYTNGCVTRPDDAFRWAKGESIAGGGDGTPLQILKPLDWYAVSDHAEWLGVFRKMEDPASPLSKLPIAARITSDTIAVRFAAFAEVLNAFSRGEPMPGLNDPEVSKTIWQEIVETTDEHYDPGHFTTFAAFEWSSNPGQQNLHRVVFFKNSEHIPELPYSSQESEKPEDLWRWMDAQRAAGATLLAIPHNGNASNGLMFPEKTAYGGSSLDQPYAEARMRNEPVYEISQIKGTSETMPQLSPNDEFAGFELWDYTLSADAKPPARKKGGYMREALIRGLQLEQGGHGNPFKYGFIGDSDTHNSASSVEENNYTGKFGMENDPQHRLLGPPGFAEANKQQIREFSSGGLAGVWAEANTRDAIFQAIARKETFATSGPRMRVRFFGSFDYTNASMDGDWLANAYAQGVPMGGDLATAPAGKAPVFLVQALKEADGANLDRIQIVKGWVAGGKTHEKIYDVALSDDRAPGANGKAPPVGNTVDVKNASYTNTIGDAQLQVVWSDPDFDAAQYAVYYARVLEIPTPRWSVYDAKKLGIDPPADLPTSIQERAWSSPIWYTP